MFIRHLFYAQSTYAERQAQLKFLIVILTYSFQVEAELASDRIRRATAEEDYYDDSLGSRGAENGNFSKDRRGGIEAVYRSRKEKKFLLKKPMSVGYDNNVHVNDVREACSGTEEGLAYKATEDEIEAEVTNSKYRHSSQFSKRRSRPIFSGGSPSSLVCGYESKVFLFSFLLIEPLN